MRILGLDSSGIVASVAVVEDDVLVAEYTINYKKTHSQTLLPMLDEIVKMTELDLESIDAIAVAAGPGSFTGLRIGSATAKGLGLALKKPLVAIPTVEGLAYNLYDTPGLICPIMDARRKQVYTGIYRFTDHRLETVEEQMAVPVEEMIKKLNAYGQPVTFLGDGVPVFCELITEKMEVPYSFAPAHVNKQRAAAVPDPPNCMHWDLFIIVKEKQKLQWNMYRTICEYPRQSVSVQNGRRQKLTVTHDVS